MERILLVCSGEKSRQTLLQLTGEGCPGQLHQAPAGAAARRMMMEIEFDLIVINAPLSDEPGDALARHAVRTTGAAVLLLLKAPQAEVVTPAMEEFGIAVLPKPISRASFSSALHLLRASHSRLLQMQEQARKLRKQLEELRLVSRAKCILIETSGLTEPEAHAFLEKQAMNRRMTKVDVARELLQARE